MERLLIPAIDSYHKLTDALSLKFCILLCVRFLRCLKTFPEMVSQVSFQTSAIMWIKKAKVPSRSKHPSLIYPKLHFWKTINFSQLFTSSLLPATVLMISFFFRVWVLHGWVVVVAIYAKTQSFLFRFWPCPVAWGILVPQPGVQPGLLAVRAWVLTTGPPGNSQKQFLRSFYFLVGFCLLDHLLRNTKLFWEAGWSALFSQLHPAGWLHSCPYLSKAARSHAVRGLYWRLKQPAW